MRIQAKAKGSISVIVPVFYGQKYVPDMIRQIELCKKYLEENIYVEIVFVNDSPSVPLSITSRSESVEIIVVDSEKNVGIHGARIKGLKRCSGEYVLFLDQDDRILPEYFYSQLQAIGESDAVICEAVCAGRNVYSPQNCFEDLISDEYVLRNWNPIISPGQVLIRKDAIPSVWIENIIQHNGADDWLLWLCMLAGGWKVSLNEKILYEHISQGFNASNHVVEMLCSEQEILSIVWEQKLFGEKEKRWLLDGFFRRNLARTRELNLVKTKMQLLEKWMRLRERGINYSDYLHRSGIRTAAIYGCGMFGQSLYHELKYDIEIKYFIDKNAEKIKKAVPVYMLQDDLPEIDGVIITLVDGIEQVVNEIRCKGRQKIFILKHWIMETEAYVCGEENRIFP